MTRALSVATLLLLAMAAGYPNAALGQVAEEDLFVDPSFEGRIIDEIMFLGMKRTHEWVPRRELKSAVGEPLELATLSRDLRYIDRLGVYSSIEIEAKEVEGKLVVEIRLEETFPYLPTINIKISDEDGVQYGAGLKSVSLLGRGIFLSGAILTGGANNINLTLTNSWLFGKHLGYLLEANHRERSNELYGFEENSDELLTTLTWPLGETKWIGARLNYESIEADNSSSTLSDNQKDNVTTAALFIDQTTLDSWTNPKRGWWNQLEIRRHGVFNTDSSFWRAIVDIRRFQPIAKSHTLALFSLTQVSSGEVGVEIAPWQQLSLGGTSTIRGWENGSRTGKNETINTIEYRWNFIEPRVFRLFGIGARLGLQAAAFTDIGMAWTNKRDFNTDRLIAGYGAGLRLLMPFSGIARLDFAFGQPKLEIQFHIGAKEKAVRQRERIR